MPDAVESWTWLVAAKPALAALALVILWIAESAAPLFANRTRRLSHGSANLALGLLNVVPTTAIFVCRTGWTGFCAG